MLIDLQQPIIKAEACKERVVTLAVTFLAGNDDRTSVSSAVGGGYTSVALARFLSIRRSLPNCYTLSRISHGGVSSLHKPLVHLLVGIIDVFCPAPPVNPLKLGTLARMTLFMHSFMTSISCSAQLDIHTASSLMVPTIFLHYLLLLYSTLNTSAALDHQSGSISPSQSYASWQAPAGADHCSSHQISS